MSHNHASSLYKVVSKCKVAYMDLQGIIPWRSCDFQYWIYHILRLVIITAQIVEIAGFVILEREFSISAVVPIQFNTDRFLLGGLHCTLYNEAFHAIQNH
ncbi:hypothetical protein ACN38_g6386, partial [Penicillium nordicum]